MTPQQKIIALAELEGWTRKEDFESSFANPAQMVSRGFKWFDKNNFQRNLPDYLTSHDALQPLLEKMTEKEWGKMMQEVMRLGRKAFQTYCELCLTLTPEQKANCILKACGKWEE